MHHCFSDQSGKLCVKKFELQLMILIRTFPCSSLFSELSIIFLFLCQKESCVIPVAFLC